MRIERGQEFKTKWGERVVVLNKSIVRDTVCAIDEVYFVSEFPRKEFERVYTPTGRQNRALKTFFNNENFERVKNDTKGSDRAPFKGVEVDYYV